MYSEDAHTRRDTIRTMCFNLSFIQIFLKSKIITKVEFYWDTYAYILPKWKKFEKYRALFICVIMISLKIISTVRLSFIYYLL